MTNLGCMTEVYQVEGVNFLGVKDSVMGSYPPYKGRQLGNEAKT